MPTLLTGHDPVDADTDHLAGPDPSFALDIVKRKDLFCHVHRPAALGPRLHRRRRCARAIRRVERLEPRRGQEHELEPLLPGHVGGLAQAHAAIVGRVLGDRDDLIEGVGLAGAAAAVAADVAADRVCHGLDGPDRVWLVAFVMSWKDQFRPRKCHRTKHNITLRTEGSDTHCQSGP